MGRNIRRGGDGYVYGPDGGDGFTDIHMHPKLIDLYTLNMYNFSFINHTSTK